MKDPTTRTNQPAPDTTHPLEDPAATTGESPSLSAAAHAAIASERYLLGDEIARGGMGVIYRAVDTVLDREVAVKVLQERYSPASGTARRFAEEARITGQLQHPGVPPVHDLGVLPDGRPFLAMKFIKGETLDRRLKDRSSPAEDRGQMLVAFEQLCQAVAYAHAHGVIHRDLKPANVMVGGFGEVQVMDWGLAKVLSGGAAGEPDAPDDPEATSAGNEVRSPRGADDEFTQAGSVLGTPAYMPPEQAVGAIDQIDARSDVFGLGGILAAVLTGRPPFQSETAESTRQQAARGDLGDCFARLDACGAESELVALCKRCLAPDRGARPADAGAVARAAAEFREAAEERARTAELDRVRLEGERTKAELRAAEQRKRRRVLLGLLGATAVAAVALVGLVVAGTYSTRLNTAYESETRARAAEQDQREKVEAALTAEAAQRQRAESAQAEEEQQRIRAETAQAEEEVQRKIAEGAQRNAEDARRSAEEARDALDRALNLTKVFVAGSALREHDPGQAVQRLGEVDPDFRGWDWRFLNALCHPELISFPLGTRDPWTGAARVVPEAARRLAKPVAYSPDETRVAGTVPRATTASVLRLGVRLVQLPVPGALPLPALAALDELRAAAADGVSPPPSPRERLGLTIRALQPPLVGGAPPVFALAAVREARVALRTRVRVLDSTTGREVSSIVVPEPVTAIDFLPGGRVALTEQTGVLRVYDARTGNPAFPPLTGYFTWSFSPDRSQLVGSGGNGKQLGRLAVFDAATGAVVCRIAAPEHVYPPAVTPDNRWLVGGSPSGAVRVFDARTGRQERTFTSSTRHPRVVLSPDGVHLATAPHNQGPVSVYNLRTGAPVADLELPEYAGSLPAFSPDGGRLAAVGPDGTVRIFDVPGRQEVGRIAAPALLSAPRFGPDGMRLAASGSDGLVRVYDARVIPTNAAFAGTVPEGHARLVPATRTYPVNQGDAFALSPDGSELLIQVFPKRDRDSFIGQPWSLWRVNLRTGIQTRLLRDVHQGYRPEFGPGASRIAITVDPAPGSRAAKEGLDSGTDLLDGTTGRKLFPLKGRCFPDRAFSPDGRRLQTLTPDGSVHVYDTGTGKELCVIPPGAIRKRPPPERKVDPADLLVPATEWWKREWAAVGKQPLEFAPTGDRLAEPEVDGVRVYDTRTGEVAVTLRAEGVVLTHPVRFTPDGSALAARASDGSVRFFDLATGRNTLTVRGTGKMVFQAFDPTGARFAALDGDELGVFEVATGRPLFTLPVRAVGGRLFGGPTFSPDGARLVACGKGGDVRMFDARTGQETFAPTVPGERVVKTGLAVRENLLFSPDGGRLVFLSPSGLHVWDAPRDLAEHQAQRREGLRAGARTWHLDQLRYHEGRGNPAGMAFHAGRLCELEPANAGMHFAHGLSLNLLGRTDRARAAFAAALTRKAALPDDVRMDAHAELEQWDEAGAIADRLASAARPAPIAVYRHGLLTLRTDGGAGYAEACADALARLGRAPNADAARWLAQLCSLAPDAVPRYDVPLQMAQALVRGNPKQGVPHHLLGALLYRSGQFKGAVATLSQADSLGLKGYTVANDLFLAMAHYRLGQFEEAGARLRAATRLAAEQPAGTWVNRVRRQLLVTEADALLAERVAPPPRAVNPCAGVG